MKIGRILVAAFFLTVSTAAKTCSPVAGAPPPAPSRDQQVASADLIVSGTVQKSESAGDFAVKVWLSVEQTLKGQAAHDVVFLVALPSTNCPELEGHFPVTIGAGRQLIFLKRSLPPEQTFYAIHAEDGGK